ncbi:MAG: hypothetical protein GX084_06505 [Acholeplasmataceae bacterium]|jgi:hypothetical protein|nr:hypothetical protein [Acidaminococcaceae bacterium]NLY84247.1 hypothetical protein [Acholeplasmataceae bacterium]
MVEATNTELVSRILQVFFVSFVYIFGVARAIGAENKMKWFKRRTKTTFFSQKGFLGEYINFGYPRTWQGLVVFVAIYGVIFGLGYFYVFRF